jgi:hypothetical protein
MRPDTCKRAGQWAREASELKEADGAGGNCAHERSCRPRLHTKQTDLRDLDGGKPELSELANVLQEPRRVVLECGAMHTARARHASSHARTGTATTPTSDKAHCGREVRHHNGSGAQTGRTDADNTRTHMHEGPDLVRGLHQRPGRGGAQGWVGLHVPRHALPGRGPVARGQVMPALPVPVRLQAAYINQRAHGVQAKRGEGGASTKRRGEGGARRKEGVLSINPKGGGANEMMPGEWHRSSSACAGAGQRRWQLRSTGGKPHAAHTPPSVPHPARRPC